MQNYAKVRGLTEFISMQNFHNAIYREEEREMIPYCNAHGIGIIPWGPLHAGDLARPLGQTTARTEQAKGGPFERPHSEVDKIIIGRVDELAKKKGWTTGQVALAWIDTKVSSPIVGLSSVSIRIIGDMEM